MKIRLHVHKYTRTHVSEPEREQVYEHESSIPASFPLGYSYVEDKEWSTIFGRYCNEI